jgi:death-associated protein kinase
MKYWIQYLVVKHFLLFIIFFISSGKFATVKRCVEKISGNEFAAKFIRKRRSNGRMGQKLEDINREIQILKEIKHENIIILLDVFDNGNEVILVLELSVNY